MTPGRKRDNQIHLGSISLRLIFLDTLMPLQFQPMPLQKRSVPFDDDDWLFELKYDGFRALAEIEYGRCRLISRSGNAFSGSRAENRENCSPAADGCAFRLVQNRRDGSDSAFDFC